MDDDRDQLLSVAAPDGLGADLHPRGGVGYIAAGRLQAYRVGPTLIRRPERPDAGVRPAGDSPAIQRFRIGRIGTSLR